MQRTSALQYLHHRIGLNKLNYVCLSLVGKKHSIYGLFQYFHTEAADIVPRQRVSAASACGLTPYCRPTAIIISAQAAIKHVAKCFVYLLSIRNCTQLDTFRPHSMGQNPQHEAMSLGLHSWANTGLIAVYQKLPAVRESKKASSPNLQPRTLGLHFFACPLPSSQLKQLGDALIFKWR